MRPAFGGFIPMLGEGVHNKAASLAELLGPDSQLPNRVAPLCSEVVAKGTGRARTEEGSVLGWRKSHGHGFLGAHPCLAPEDVEESWFAGQNGFPG